MKIVRVLPSGRVVVCSDTSRVNRGEVYFVSQGYEYGLMPCVYFHLNGNSRRSAPHSMELLIDQFGFAYHLENKTLATVGAEDARVYSEDRSLITGMSAPFSKQEWYQIREYTFDSSTPSSMLTFPSPDLAIVLSTLVSVTRWLTFNAGDWLVYGLLPTPFALSCPTRVRLFANEKLVLDELLRS